MVECNHVRRPGVPEKPPVQRRHLRGADQVDAQFAWFAAGKLFQHRPHEPAQMARVHQPDALPVAQGDEAGHAFFARCSS
jgi:hypothetical protein